MGMVQSAYIPRVYSFWRHRYVMSPLLFKNRLSRGATGDLGAAVHGKIPGGFGDYRIVAANGEGKTNAEVSAGKAIEGSVKLYPLAMVDSMKGLGLMALYRFDKQEPDYVELSHTVFDVILGYKMDIDETMGFSVNGEYAQRSTTSGDEEISPLIAGSDLNPLVSTAYSIWGDFWFMSKYGVLARYDFFDPNTENDEDANIGWQDEETTLLAGVWYQPIKQVRLCANYREIGYTAEIPDDKGDQVAMQPDKFIFVNTEVKF